MHAHFDNSSFSYSCEISSRPLHLQEAPAMAEGPRDADALVSIEKNLEIDERP